MSKIKSVDFVKKYTMIIVLIIVTAFFAWRTGGAILLPMNVSSLISQNAYVFILATGMLLCILTGGNIDLSVGSVVCFVGAIGAMLMVNMKMNMWLAILVMFAVGTLIGAFQGFWIAYVRIPPFIVTLAGMLAFRGLSNVVLDGMTVSIKDCTTFVNLFGGGADCYIPDFFGNGSVWQELDEFHFLRQVNVTASCVLLVDRCDHDLVSEDELVFYTNCHLVVRVNEAERFEVHVIVQCSFHVLAVQIRYKTVSGINDISEILDVFELVAFLLSGSFCRMIAH